MKIHFSLTNSAISRRKLCQVLGERGLNLTWTRAPASSQACLTSAQLKGGSWSIFFCSFRSQTIKRSLSRMQPRRPTLKKSVATINSSDGDTLKGCFTEWYLNKYLYTFCIEGTPAEKRVMIIIDGNSPSSSETTSSSSCLSSSSSSSEAKESTATDW